MDNQDKNEDISNPMSSDDLYPGPPDDVEDGQDAVEIAIGEVEVDGTGTVGHPFDLFIPLGSRVKRAIHASSYKSLEDLHNATDEELRAIKGVGARSINPIRGLLASKGFEEKNALPPVDVAKIEAEAKKASVEVARKELPQQQPIEYDPSKSYESAENIVFSNWEGSKYQYNIGQSLDGAPESLQREMVTRGEAREAKEE